VDAAIRVWKAIFEGLLPGGVDFGFGSDDLSFTNTLLLSGGRQRRSNLGRKYDVPEQMERCNQ